MAYDEQYVYEQSVEYTRQVQIAERNYSEYIIIRLFGPIFAVGIVRPLGYGMVASRPPYIFPYTQHAVPTQMTPLIWIREAASQSEQIQPSIDQRSIQVEVDGVQCVLPHGQRLRKTNMDLKPSIETQPELTTKDEAILRQLHTTQVRISIWGFLASSSIYKDVIVRALSRIQVNSAKSRSWCI